MPSLTICLPQDEIVFCFSLVDTIIATTTWSTSNLLAYVFIIMHVKVVDEP